MLGKKLSFRKKSSVPRLLSFKKIGNDIPIVLKRDKDYLETPIPNSAKLYPKQTHEEIKNMEKDYQSENVQESISEMKDTLAKIICVLGPSTLHLIDGNNLIEEIEVKFAFEPLGIDNNDTIEADEDLVVEFSEENSLEKYYF